MNETEWQRRVMETAKLHGWRCCHYRPARVGKGSRQRYVTPVVGDRGGPDLLLARRGVVLLAELKTDTGVVEPRQRLWAEQLGDHYRLWRPRDWETLVLPELSG